jgi:hypothetical protein
LGAASAAVMGGEPVAGAIGAIVGEIIGQTYREGGLGNTPLDQNSDTYQTQVEYGVAFAKMAAVLCVGMMGGDVEAAAFAAENAARHNALMFVFDGTSPILRAVDDGIPEEEAPQDTSKRGRSLARAPHGEGTRTRTPSPTRLKNTHIEEGKRKLVQGVQALYEEQAAFSLESATLKSTSMTAGAYCLDGVGLVADAVDTVTFGASTWVGERMDEGATLAGTYTRRGVRFVTGDQRAAQNIGDSLTLVLTAANPLGKTGLAKNAQVLSTVAKAAQKTKLVQETVSFAQKIPSVLRTTAAPSVEQRLLSMRGGVEQSATRVRLINNRKPINSEFAGQVYPLERLPENLRQIYPHSVPFTGSGHPDFSRYATKKVKIEVTGSNPIDKARANKAAGYSKTPKGSTWHHHHDGQSMYLVPEDLHDAVKHTGGAAIVRGQKK